MPKDFSKLKLEGATADQAVDCMRKDGVMPHSPDFENPSHSTVVIREDGAVFVKETGSHADSKDFKLEYESAIKPASGEKPAEMVTPEVAAAGPGVERLRQRAIACAVKGIGGP
jgi:hypothetical protein